MVYGILLYISLICSYPCIRGQIPLYEYVYDVWLGMGVSSYNMIVVQYIYFFLLQRVRMCVPNHRPLETGMPKAF